MAPAPRMALPVSAPADPLLPRRDVDPRRTCPTSSRRSFERWRERDVFQALAAGPRGRAVVGLLRGAPDRQRAAGLPSRPLAGLQGHLSPLPDDARLPRRAQGRLGLPRPAGRDRRRKGARDPAQGRDRGVRDRRLQREVPRVGLHLPRGVGPADRADRLLARPRARLPHAGRDLHRVGLVGAVGDRPAGPALRGQQGRPLLPALRDDPLLARGRPGLPGRRRSERLPQAPRLAGRGAAARLDDHAVDAAGERRAWRSRRRPPTRGCAPRASCSCSPRRASRRCWARTPRSSSGSRAPSSSSASAPTRGRSSPPTDRGARAAADPPGRLRDHRGRDGHRPSGPRLRRGRLPRRGRLAAGPVRPDGRGDALQPGAARRHLRRACPRPQRLHL